MTPAAERCLGDALAGFARSPSGAWAFTGDADAVAGALQGLAAELQELRAELDAHRAQMLEGVLQGMGESARPGTDFDAWLASHDPEPDPFAATPPVPGESPTERRALARVKALPGLHGVMLAQLHKGHAAYGGPIDGCGYTRERMVRATAEEGADLIVYLEALTCPADVMRAAQTVASWLEGEL